MCVQPYILYIYILYILYRFTHFKGSSAACWYSFSFVLVFVYSICLYIVFFYYRQVPLVFSPPISYFWFSHSKVTRHCDACEGGWVASSYILNRCSHELILSEGIDSIERDFDCITSVRFYRTSNIRYCIE